jgi:hypothetical protein
VVFLRHLGLGSLHLGSCFREPCLSSIKVIP